jgi:hypothetical protein
LEIVADTVETSVDISIQELLLMRSPFLLLCGLAQGCLFSSPTIKQTLELSSVDFLPHGLIVGMYLCMEYPSIQSLLSLFSSTTGANSRKRSWVKNIAGCEPQNAPTDYKSPR